MKPQKSELLMLSTENTLFLSLIGSDSDTLLSEKIGRLTGRRLDWNSFLMSAKSNRVAPLIYHNLKRNNADFEVPAPVWKELETAYHHSGVQNTLLYIELRRILRSFENAGIDVIVLKGAALAEDVWKNIALREMIDIDLLVQEEELERADDILTHMGYIWYEGYRPRDWYKKNHHHLAPRHNPTKKMIVEIHRNIVPPNELFRIDSEALWERAATIDFGGVNAKVLSPVDLLIHMCLHLSLGGSFTGQIRTLADICRVVECYRERIDWNWMIQTSKENNFAKFLYYPLFLAADILHAKIDPGVLKSLRTATEMSWLEDRLVRTIARRIIFAKDEPESLVPAWFTQGLCKDILHKDHFNSLARLLSPPAGNFEKGVFPKDTPWFARYAPTAHRIAGLILKAARMKIRQIFGRVGATAAG